MIGSVLVPVKALIMNTLGELRVSRRFTIADSTARDSTASWSTFRPGRACGTSNAAVFTTGQ